MHLSCYNRQENPLDVFLRSEEEYKGWQEWKGNLDENGKIIKQKFTRDLIFSTAQIYNEGRNDIHLFTGIYKITKRFEDRYEVEKLPIFENMIGRLKIQYKRPGQGSSFYLENSLKDMKVCEILKERMEYKLFTALDKINLRFTELEVIIKKNVMEWRTRLDKLHGVYLLIDDSNSKKYVGSATGEFGIWQRWSNYVYNYTGGNKGLDDLQKEVGEEHFKQHFRFILLEYFTDKTDQDYILKRESYFKDILNTRKEKHGYNHN